MSESSSPVGGMAGAGCKKSHRTSSGSHLFWPTTMLLVASFAVRLAAWAYWGTGTIESEGAEYCKLAQNLRNGVGYVGLASPGAQVLFNPLFPLLIAGASFFTHNYELAGRLVSLVLGALLPLPMCGIASRVFNRRVGYMAAALGVLHPLLIHLSFTVYSEGPYATLFLTAIYVGLRILDHPSTMLWLLLGGTFGLCFLLRAEAFAAFAIASVFCFYATTGNRGVRWKRVGYALAVFLALALPESTFLYRSTGKVLLEGKSTVLFSYTGQRVLVAERHPGVAYESADGALEQPSSAPDTPGGYPERWQDKWAFYGTNSKGEGTGSAVRSNVDIVRQTHMRFRDLLPLLVRGARRNVPGLVQKLSSGWLGAPLLPALAFLGAFRRPWHGAPGRARLFLMVLSTAPVLATLFVLWSDARYYFIFVPLLSIWAAAGLFEVGQWMRASTAAAGWNKLARPAVSQCTVPALLGAAMIVSPVKQVITLYEFGDSAPPYRIDREVGLWIKGQQAGPARIMDLSLPLSYHAGAQQLVYFPYCTSDLALRYLDAEKVDYIILRRAEKFTKYYEDWLTHGIPDDRAEVLQLPSVAAASKFVIYRWHGSAYAHNSRTETISSGHAVQPPTAPRQLHRGSRTMQK